jgi:UV excision repair protein RAD23
MNGIPPNFPPAGTPMPQAARAPAPAAGGAPGAAAPAGGAGALAALRQHPQFNQMRQLVQENPAALEPLLQQIGAQSPGTPTTPTHTHTAEEKKRGVIAG